MTITRFTYIALCLMFWSIFSWALYSQGSEDQTLLARVIPSVIVGAPLAFLSTLAIWLRTKTWDSSWDKPRGGNHGGD